MKQTVRQHIASLLLSGKRRRRGLAIFVVMALLVSVTVAGLLKRYGVAVTHQETELEIPYADESYDAHVVDELYNDDLSPADDDFAADAEAENGEETPATNEATLYQDINGLSVEAIISDSEPIPTDARLVVTPLTSDMDSYDAYLAALNRDFGDDVYTSSNALFYDITVMADGEEFEPTNGRIDITLDFKKNQLSEELGLPIDDESSIRVTHLPVDSDKQPAIEDIADPIDPDDITVEHVADTKVEAGSTEKLTFSLSSLSVITVTGAPTDVTVNASLLGTDMQSLGYNLYAYLLSNNDSNAYGAKINFENGNATATISNVPANTYRAPVCPVVVISDASPRR